MKKLTRKLKNDINFEKKVRLTISKDLVNYYDLKILRKTLGSGNYTQTFKKAIELIAFNQMNTGAEFISQITYNEKALSFIASISKLDNLKEEINEMQYYGDDEDPSENVYKVNIELWKVIICLEYFKQKISHINEFKHEDFLKLVIERSIEIIYNLFPEVR